ncbi:MAG: hypothetical protein ABW224_00760 [Kibdelosporangium sp.]
MTTNRLLGVAAVIGAGLALAGCNNVSAGSPTTQPPTTQPPTVASSGAPGTGQPATTATTKAGSGGGTSGGSDNGGSSSGGSNNSGGGNSGGSGGGGGGGKSTSSSSPPPATASISVKKQPLCPRTGTPDAPFTTPGQDVTITWKVTGATGAAISLDQPNHYGSYGSSYPASGELTLPFSCNNTPGKTSHTYTVWPAGNKSVSRSITVSATNNPSA